MTVDRRDSDFERYVELYKNGEYVTEHWYIVGIDDFDNPKEVLLQSRYFG